jgi:hypothetical protein
MKKLLLLACFLLPIFIVGCEYEFEESSHEFLGGSFLGFFFVIALCLAIIVFASEHFDWGVMDMVADFPPGCAIVIFCIVLGIGVFLWLWGNIAALFEAIGRFFSL